jgi:hypothetical protein
MQQKYPVNPEYVAKPSRFGNEEAEGEIRSQTHVLMV